MLPICSLRRAAFQRLRAAAPWLRERRGPPATTCCVAFWQTSPDPHVSLVARCTYYCTALDSRAELVCRWIDHEHMAIKLAFEQKKRSLMARARNSFSSPWLLFRGINSLWGKSVSDFFILCIRVIFLIHF